jgi:G protein pathway suppressor 2
MFIYNIIINYLSFSDQEADAEVERQRKERERQQKQHVFTLNETREQITQSEARLTDLKEEKHQLFLQLKKVLNEDEIRKRQLMSQENEMIRMHQFNVSQYTNPPRIQMVSSEQSSQHHTGFIQPIQLSRTPVSIAQAQVFKVEGGGGRQAPPVQSSQHHSTSPHNSMPITVKRLRTPSPPPPQNYRFGPFKPPPQAIPQYSHQSKFTNQNEILRAK